MRIGACKQLSCNRSGLLCREKHLAAVRVIAHGKRDAVPLRVGADKHPVLLAQNGMRVTRERLGIGVLGEGGAGHGSALQCQSQTTQGGQCLDGLAASCCGICLRLAQVEHGHVQRVVHVCVQLDGIKGARDGQ